MNTLRQSLAGKFLSVGILLVFIYPADSLAQTESGAQKWEYSIMTFVTALIKNYNLRFPDKSFNAIDLNELGEKLIGRQISKEESILGLIMSNIGNQGWKLVKVVNDHGTLDSTQYFFKRPKQ
ncbi:hypothetical protein [Deinococcus frigens]|uniref:hypothetical protein n=1 Tax=Deinococcus frigens TaxID=249403 RepID=UPI0012EC7FC4|nr:hypothetical protein [Deinococcus frigens]